MEFVVTSVASDETAAILREATSTLGDLIQSRLSNDNFGNGIEQFTIVVVAVDDDASENLAWARPHDKLGAFTHPVSGERIRFLSVSALIPPAQLLSSAPKVALATIRQAVKTSLAVRPKRVPRGLEFRELARAVSVAIA